MKPIALFVTLSVLFSLLLGSVGVYAQAPEPPEGYPYHDREQPTREIHTLNQPYDLEQRKSPDIPFPRSLSAPTGAASPSVTLGKPGLSFRYVDTFGVTESAYISDTTYLNGPRGMVIDSNDNLFVVEERGARLHKYNASHVHQLSIGFEGLHYVDEYVFSWPADVALDSGGNIWVADYNRVTQYDSAGNFLQVFPDWDDDPWDEGSDNGHFSGPKGIAFDSTGRLYVSDSENHRVQVFSLSGGTPVYSSTIGITGVPGSALGQFNYPYQIVIDSSDRLYVTDTENYRIQRCTYSPGWSCEYFHGTGIQGSAVSQLDWVDGIGIDTSDNIYIADSGNDRFKRCNTSKVCSTYNLNIGWPTDIAVDSAGNIFISHYGNSTIRKHSSLPAYSGIFVGVNGIPYLTDTTRLNAPWGIAVDTDGSIYALENRGFRLVKMNSTGSQLWTIGEPGVGGGDNQHFRWPSGNPAIDSSGRVYVPDSNKHRVQIYNSNSTYFATMGEASIAGADNDHFNRPSGVAISPLNGDIYVADRFNHRVQVFDSSRTYKTTIGTGSSGSLNYQFNEPHGVTVDSSGNVYVADRHNHRVQIFNSSHIYQRTVGTTGTCDWGFNYLCAPASVTVDAASRLYVTEQWNNRVQVFDAAGAYLTSIGGSWGSGTGELRNPSGVALDNAGNVYVTDRTNHRIQKFAPGVLGWMQSNINGFGYPWQNVNTLEVFGDQMYAGTWYNDGTAQVWRTSDGYTWNQFTPSWTISNTVVWDSKAYNSAFYVGTSNWDEGGEIWRTNGASWEQVASGGFDDTNNLSIRALEVFSNTVFAATINYSTGTEIWSSPSGNSGTWSQVNDDGFGDTNIWQDITMDVFNNFLYVGFGRGEDSATAELWRSNNGITWEPVFINGLSANNTHVSAMEDFKGNLYIGLRNVTNGGELWRSSNGFNFSPMFTGGYGNASRGRPYGLITFNNELYMVFCNTDQSLEVWHSADGTNWQPVMQSGWGDSTTTYGDYFDKGAAVFKGNLYFTGSGVTGGEVWVYLDKRIFLPLIMR